MTDPYGWGSRIAPGCGICGESSCVCARCDDCGEQLAPAEVFAIAREMYLGIDAGVSLCEHCARREHERRQRIERGI